MKLLFGSLVVLAAGLAPGISPAADEAPTGDVAPQASEAEAPEGMPSPEQTKEAVGACRARLERIEQKLAARQGRFSVMPPQDIHSLREAAIALARAGDGQGCEVVADRLQRLIAERQEEWNEAKERERITNAKPFWDVVQDLRASTVIGAEVVSTPGKELGSVEDVIFSRDAREYLLLSYGGFLGIGEELIPVPVERLRVTEDGHTLVLDVRADKKLEEAPTLEELKKIERQEWAPHVDAWWSQATQQP